MVKKEKVIHVDSQDNELGIVSRDEAHAKGIPHRIAVVYLTNESGQILVQERISGRLDHSAAGHVDPGERYVEAARRELREELGINSKLYDVGVVLSDEKEPEVNGKQIVHMMGVYQCVSEPGTLNPEEVKSVFWANPLEIYKKMQNDQANEKYCGGFKKSLELFLIKKQLL